MVATAKHQRPAAKSRYAIEANIERPGLYQRTDMKGNVDQSVGFAITKGGAVRHG
ncbi:hypothetical protein [Mesorhizobium ventifaucium]|uniref:hypothetical protein n=1 Tax=Mesorhizobium ventifaucium TaxID=666020 RepID=UPI0020A7703E|nr:hypothetical protein [Mesorhizobium ventifaucium]